MTRDPRLPGYDDATIEQLVRDVAAAWHMPPVRLTPLAGASGFAARARGDSPRQVAGSVGSARRRRRRSR